jgi:hypothetical protein
VITANVAIAAFGLWWLTQLAVPWHDKENPVSRLEHMYPIGFTFEDRLWSFGDSFDVGVIIGHDKRGRYEVEWGGDIDNSFETDKSIAAMIEGE